MVRQVIFLVDLELDEDMLPTSVAVTSNEEVPVEAAEDLREFKIFCLF